MVELYIENYLVEFKDDITIPFTYETIDPNKLSSIKNSFTKTVEIPGTKKNNEIFGDLFRIDRYIPSTQIFQYHFGVKNIGFQFDPHKKAEYQLINNGIIINRGYCVLNDIVIKNEVDITYKITLYGGIGEFFYSLAYNEDGSPKTLYDMHWAWRKRNSAYTDYDSPMNIEQENNDIIMDCSTRAVNLAYHYLKPIEEIYYDGETWEHLGESNWWYDDNTAYHITDIDKDVVFIPCYTGTYNDFDSKKMLISTFNQNYNPGIGNNVMTNDTKNKLSKSFPDQLEDYSDGSGTPTVYTTMDKTLDSTGAYRYGIATFSRDLDPWEAGDIRVNEMPVGIRLSKLMRTLSEPFNNGGYEVEWHPDILNSPYWNYSWVMLGKMNQEKEKNSVPNITLSLPTYNYANRIKYNTNTAVGIYESGYDRVVERNYTISNWTRNEYKYNFEQSFGLTFDVLVDNNRSIENNESSNLIGSDSENTNSFATYFLYRRENRNIYRNVNNYYVTLTTLYDGNEIINTQVDIFSTWGDLYDDNYMGVHNFGINGVNKDSIERKIINIINSRLGTNLTVNDLIYHYYDIHKIGNYEYNAQNVYHIKYKQNVENISLNIPVGVNNLQINQKQFVLFIVTQKTDLLEVFDGGIYGYESPSLYGEIIGDRADGFIYWWNFNHVHPNYYCTYNTEILTSYIHYADNISGFKTLQLTKQMLFANSKSPFKYLADLIKMMNWKVTADNISKKIYITPLDKYYSENIIDIDNNVDYNREIRIKNINTDSKRINVGLEPLDTYPITLFNRIDKDKFNIYHYDTGIEYNTSETNLLDDLIYKSELDWQQSSVFYNLYPQFPKAYNTPTISWTLFKRKVEEGVVTDEIDRFEKIVIGCPSIESNLVASNDWLPKISLFDKDNKYTEADTMLMFLNGFVANYDYTKIDTSEPTVLTPTSTIADKAIKTDGTIINSNYVTIYVFDNITSGLDFTTSGYWDSVEPDLLQVYYYDSDGNFLGGELPASQTQGQSVTYTDQPINVPLNCFTIKMNVNTTNSQTTNIFNLKSTNSHYSISPRISLSEDTYEQYYFTGGRCYVYDFKYNDSMANWGMYSSDQKGTAFSCAIPFFTRELYNSYESETYTENITLQPTRVLNNQYFTYIDNVYLIHGDTNWEMREYDIDLSTMSNLRFTAQYPSDQTGQILFKSSSGWMTIGVEGTFGPAQSEFVNSSINTAGGLAHLYMNVWKGNTETTYITADVEAVLPPEWKYKDEVYASWNLINQQNIMNMYNVDKARFLKNPELVFYKRPGSVQKAIVDNNEYTFELPNFISNDIYNNNWKDYMNDLYNRNTRDVTAYIDLSMFGTPNDIMSTIFKWQGFYWIPLKIENFQYGQIGKDKFTKCTLHKVADINNWI